MTYCIQIQKFLPWFNLFDLLNLEGLNRFGGRIDNDTKVDGNIVAYKTTVLDIIL
ncbi:MAG: hypothetical protein RMJ36_07035 [Candidatus Calescibacterium sp.]|nr:hypothetical protein [Candidatus Calescibacterium sp.]MDW8133390.1 hypothetical protein [Candidatus Calescibacterium sp.]